MELEVDIEKRLGSFRCTAAFTLHLPRCGVFGPSGSGKSTLMNLLAGLLVPDRGRIRLAGHTLYDGEAGINLPPEQRRIGVVFQHARLFPHMNVRRNLLYGWRRTDAGDRRIDPEALIEVLNLGHLLHRGVNRLSGGERQRVALGRTVLACPRLILMDEPLTGLDEELKYQIIPYLQRALDDFAIPLLFISHSLREMRLMTDEVLVFRDGAVQAQLATESLARSDMATAGGGYTNMLHLGPPRPVGDLWRYPWGEVELVLTEGGRNGDNFVELEARDIILFKGCPAAISARNLLACKVVGLFGVSNRVGVELDCGGNRLVAQIVPESVREMGITAGVEVVAAIKASSFRRVV
ncbi:MAG: molybdenum ABC transporter ATP-binding protein [Desulfoprunum sp.]|jgi:molybdate transport system ATP-binding protein|uniref:molybdenum ABC transporter ATP-binding protein n=1 Tax=Desulfoprunum sp. TaxID=2020866 RepID=UPI003C756B66